MKLNVKNIVTYGLAIAITVLMTTIFSIPAVVYNGYINLGDVPVMLAGMIFGPIGAFIVGGIGSALSDIFLGYVNYALATFIIKGLEGVIASQLIKKSKNKYIIIVPLLSGIFMALGYFIFEIFLYGFYGALASVPGNLLQGIVCAILASLLYKSIGKILTNMIKN